MKERVLAEPKKSKASIKINPKNEEQKCGVHKFKFGKADAEYNEGNGDGGARTEDGGEW